MGATRGRPWSSTLIKFHFPCRIAYVGASRQDETRAHDNEKLSLDDIACWTEARLLSPGSIELVAGHSAAVTASCSGVEPLHAITTARASDGKASAVYLKSLAVRLSRCSAGSSPSQRNSGSGPGCGGAITTAVDDTLVSVDLWAELQVLVRRNTHICADPALRHAWRLILPHLVSGNREDAPVIVSAEPAAALECTGASSQVPSSEAGRQIRALEAVYASLKADTRRGSLVNGEDSALGPGPGASGLNALPAAVVLKGKRGCWFLVLSSCRRLRLYVTLSQA